ncbi:hypothetical protein IAU60_004333 [Kwoniella sp. DSM 27419]
MRAALWTAVVLAYGLGWVSAGLIPADTPSQLVLGEGKGPRPLVIWHGLGDTALSSGIQSFIDHVKLVHEGIYVHSVQVPLDGSLDDERRAGFWGDAVQQGQDGCDQLRGVPELEGGFDAIGFSQGGLFMRYYAQYCNDPPVRNLITFGTPHFGISALIPCPTPPTLSCILAARAARAGIYRPYAQKHIVQAAYFRDTERLDEFWQVNEFLRDLNGEKGLAEDADLDVTAHEIAAGHVRGRGTSKGEHGAGHGLNHLQNLVAVMFEEDRTVSPAQSAHFGTYPPFSSNKTSIVPITQQPMYKYDWAGLRSLDENGRLSLETCPGEHMDIGAPGDGGCGDQMVAKWVGWRE